MERAVTTEGSLCSSDIHQDLLTALRSGNQHTFLQLLYSRPGVDVDHWYDDPDYCTLLEVACSLPEHGVVCIQELLQRGADPNLVNKQRRRSPIHVAADSGNVAALRLLLDSRMLDVNQLNELGDTAFHVAAKKLTSTPGPHDQFIELLLQTPGIDINIPNRKNYTGLHLVVLKASAETVDKVLASGQHDLDSFVPTKEKKSTRQLLKEKFPAVELPVTTVDKNSDSEIKGRLFRYLYRNETNNFIAEISDILHKDMKKVMKWHDGSYTLLQYASSKGQVDIVAFLLGLNFDPQYTTDFNPKQAVYLACENGYHRVLQEFLYHNACNFTSIEGKTLLHAIVLGKRLLHNSAEQDYDKCLNLILQKLDRLVIDIDSTDEKGNTALHYAAKSDFSTVVMALLNHGAYIGVKNAFGDPPLSNMDPKILENFLDSRMSKNKVYPRDEDFELEFNFEFLVPPSAKKMAKNLSGHVQYRKSNGDMAEYSAVYLNTNVNRDSELPGSNTFRNYDEEKKEMADDPNLSPETDPLYYISHSHDLRHLLKHPIFSSFLYLKWRCIRKFFYINLAFYLLFVTLLSVYVLFIYGEAQLDKTQENTSPNISAPNNHTATNEIKSESNITIIIWIFLVVFEVILISREIFQFAISYKRYLRSPENFLEILLIVVTSVIIFKNEGSNVIRKHLSAISILLSWAELVLLIGRHPMLSTNIEMLKRVSWNFLKFLAWYSILIVAFALSFYTLFRDCAAADCGDEENFFLDPGMSVLKTVVMLTGEFDASSIPFISFPITSQLVFVLFVFLIAIVLFNLLNGLAVSDTQAIKNDAEIVSLVSRVKLIYYFETMLLGNPLSFLQTLLPCCFCCISMAKCFNFKNRFFRTIFLNCSLFPHKLSELKIYVLPNQECRVVFDSAEHRRKQEQVYGSGSYKRIFTSGVIGLCTLDPEIGKTACNILSNDGKKSEVQALEEKLEEIQKQIMCYNSQFSALQTTLRELANHFHHVGGNHFE